MDGLKKYWPILFLLIAICLPLDPNRYVWQIITGSIAFVLLFSYIIANRVNLLVGILFGYCAISAINFSAYETLVFMFVVIIPILITTKEYLRSWLDGFVIVGLISSAIILYHFFHRDNLIYGILSNSGEDATYLGLIIPYIWSQNRWRKCILLVGPCILLAHSSTGFALLALQLFLIGAFKIKGRLHKSIYTIIAAVIIPLSGKLILGDKLLNNDGRYTIWQLTFETFKKFTTHLTMFTGFGAGSFSTIMLQLQAKQIHPFLWAHNDFLQVLFEYGIVGLILTFCLYFTMLWKSRNSGWIMATLLSMFIGAFIQMPLRLMPTALFYALMCRISLRVEEGNSIYDQI